MHIQKWFKLGDGWESIYTLVVGRANHSCGRDLFYDTEGVEDTM